MVQTDLWNMKPDAPQGIRSLFQPISTRVPGIQICDQMPLLANFMDKVVIVRSVTHKSDKVALVRKGSRGLHSVPAPRNGMRTVAQWQRIVASWQSPRVERNGTHSIPSYHTGDCPSNVRTNQDVILHDYGLWPP